MEDHQKSKAQLIEELQTLRHRLAQLETDEKEPASSSEKVTSPREQRNELQTGIKFIPDFGLVNAQGVDVSDRGICFETSEEILFEMEFNYEDEAHQHRAKMIWMKVLENGNTRFGFSFIEGEASSGLLWIYKGLEE